jgi:hypothetical protein
METVRGSRNECAARPHSPCCVDTTEGIYLGDDGDIERQTCDKTVQELPEDEAETILGESFLGARLFCQHRWNRRRSNKEVREVPGRRGKAYRRATTTIRVLEPPMGAIFLSKPPSQKVDYLLALIIAKL